MVGLLRSGKRLSMGGTAAGAVDSTFEATMQLRRQALAALRAEAAMGSDDVEGGQVGRMWSSGAGAGAAGPLGFSPPVAAAAAEQEEENAQFERNISGLHAELRIGSEAFEDNHPEAVDNQHALIGRVGRADATTTHMHEKMAVFIDGAAVKEQFPRSYREQEGLAGGERVITDE